MGCPSGGGGCGPRDATELMEMVREQRKQRRIDRLVGLAAGVMSDSNMNDPKLIVRFAVAVLDEIEARVP